jgi:hypothetical protein
MTIAVIFTSRRTPDHDEEYAVMAARMDQLVREQPGFISITSVRNPQTFTQWLPYIGPSVGGSDSQVLIPVVTSQTISVSLDCSQR